MALREMLRPVITDLFCFRENGMGVFFKRPIRKLRKPICDIVFCVMSFLFRCFDFLLSCFEFLVYAFCVRCCSF